MAAGRFAAALAGLCLALPGAVQASEAGEPEDQAGAAEAPEDRKDPCRGEAEADVDQFERLREGVAISVCATARWFDGMFGDQREYAESYGDTFGRFGGHVTWDERDEVTLDGHFRVNVHLPALGERFDAVIGRESDETFITDDFDDLSYLAGSFSDEGDESWYAGLNYNAISGTRSRFDVTAGVKLESPLNPYLKARYRYFVFPADSLQLTLRGTPFWENDDGFGLTLAVDSDWSIDRKQLLRWTNSVTWSEATEGVRWRSRLSLRQLLTPISAMRYEAFIRGETEGIEPDYYGFQLTYRRSVWREWFFIEGFGGVFWSDDENPERVCEACASVGLGFDVLFGDRYEGWSDRARESLATGGGGAVD